MIWTRRSDSKKTCRLSGSLEAEHAMIGESGNRLVGWSLLLARYRRHGFFATTLPFSHT